MNKIMYPVCLQVAALAASGGLAVASNDAALTERLVVVRQEMDSAQTAHQAPSTSSTIEVAAIVQAAMAVNDIGVARDALASVSWGERLDLAAQSPEMVNAATRALASEDSGLRSLSSNILVRLQIPPNDQVCDAARAALDDPDPSVVINCIRILRRPNATIDPALLERFMHDPTPEMMQFYHPEADSTTQWEWVIREEAMRLRIQHGTLASDLDVYPTLSTMGQRAATTALCHVILTPPTDPALADQAIATKCAVFIIDQLGLPTTEWNTDDPQAREYLGSISWVLSSLASHASQGTAHPAVLDILEVRLIARRDAILAQPGGDGDHRLAGIAFVLENVTNARATLNPPSSPGSG